MRKSWIVVGICAVLLRTLVIYVFSLPKATRLPTSKYDDLLHRLAVGNHSMTLVHDCDFRIEGLVVLIDVERIYNVKSTIFVRPDAEYLSYSIAYLQKLQREGWKIGFHYNCLSRSNNSKELALELFKAQLSYLRCFFNITTTRYHGDIFNLNVNNRLLYDETLWREMDLSEVTCLEGWSYITDVNGTWNEPQTLAHDVLVNLHSDWW